MTHTWRRFRGSLCKGTFFDDLSFDALLFDKDTKDDHSITSVSTSSQVVGTLTSPALLTLKMKTNIQNREDSKDYVMVY